MHPMARRELAAVAGFIILGVVAISAQSLTPGSRTAYLTVVDRNGGLVRGLQAVDVEIREGGKPRRSSDSRSRPKLQRSPIIADLFDRTDTEQLCAALDEFVAEAPADSRIGIMTVEEDPLAPAATVRTGRS